MRCHTRLAGLLLAATITCGCSSMATALRGPGASDPLAQAASKSDRNQGTGGRAKPGDAASRSGSQDNSTTVDSRATAENSPRQSERQPADRSEPANSSAQTTNRDLAQSPRNATVSSSKPGLATHPTGADSGPRSATANDPNTPFQPSRSRTTAAATTAATNANGSATNPAASLARSPAATADGTALGASAGVATTTAAKPVSAPPGPTSAGSSASTASGFSAETLALIDTELRDASPEERAQWYAELKRVDPLLIPQILRARRLSQQLSGPSSPGVDTAAPLAEGPRGRSLSANTQDPEGTVLLAGGSTTDFTDRGPPGSGGASIGLESASARSGNGRAATGEPRYPIAGPAGAVPPAGGLVPTSGRSDAAGRPIPSAAGEELLDRDRQRITQGLARTAGAAENPVVLQGYVIDDSPAAKAGFETPPIGIGSTAGLASPASGNGSSPAGVLDAGFSPSPMSGPQPSTGVGGSAAAPNGAGSGPSSVAWPAAAGPRPSSAPPAKSSPSSTLPFGVGFVQNVVGLVPNRQAPAAVPPTGGSNVPAQLTTAAPGSAEWHAELTRAIALLEQEVATLKPAANPAAQADYVRKHVALRLLYLLAQHQERALTAIPQIDPAEQEFWQQVFWGLSNALDAEHMPRAEDRASQTINQFHAAIRRLQERADLQIRNVAFCKQIQYYGNYERFPRDEFRPGQEVLVYAEVENFKSEPTADGQYRTLLRSTLEILGPNGEVRKQIDFPGTEDLCRNYRRDYFHNYRFTIPDRLPLGPQTLKLTVMDELSGKLASYTVNFVVQ